MQCPLCHQHAKAFYKDEFYACDTCEGVFKAPYFYLSSAEEKTRYETHNNDVNDPRYQTFVSPITQAILKDFTPEHAGLDFGAGTGPVICKILKENGYTIRPYDPFFCNDEEALLETYDYIACCEVIEHFHNPHKEFARLKRLLKKGGGLFCMTDIYDPLVDFSTWYYKDDPTHVFMYTKATFDWIKSAFGFSKVVINGRLIRLSA